MPRIDDALLDCAAYLYAGVTDAERGHAIGGSGFLLEVPVGNEGLRHIVCVSNRHVIEGGFTVARLNTPTGVCVAEFDETHWFLHSGGADLAVAIIPVRSMKARHRCVSYDALLTRQMAQEEGIGVGDDVFLVGRFINHDGGQENIPTARFGHIAQMPGNPLVDDYGRDQESYLIECRSIGGFSGSPVFVHIPPGAWRPDKEAVTKEYFGDALLGVHWCHTFYPEKILGPDGREAPSHQYVPSHTGIAGVIPAWLLLELLESDTFKEQLNDARPVTTWRGEFEPS